MNPEMQPSSSRSWDEWRGWPYVLIGITVLLRVVHIWNSRSNPTFWAPALDPGWYDQAAQDILQGHWGPFPLFRAPVYPALLAATYSVFGHDLVAARMLNVVIQAITVWAILRVGQSYFSPKAGIIAAALFAFNGMAIFYTNELLSVTTEMLTASIIVWSTLRLTRDLSPVTLILCGLSWGIAVITRPNALMIYPVVAVILWILSERMVRREGRPLLDILLQKLTPVLIWVAAAFVPILPLTLANWIEGGEPVLVATQGGVNFWIGNNPESSGILSVLPGYGNAWTMEDAKLEAESELHRPVGQGELSKYFYAKGWNYLRSDPLGGLQLMIRKTLVFFNRFEISNNKHIAYFAALSPWLPSLIYLDFGILMPLGVLGAWVLWRRSQVKIIVALLLTYAASVILFFITTRFRMPAVPWMCLLSAAGLVWAVETLRQHSTSKQLLPLALLIPVTVIAWMNPWHMQEASLFWARYMEGNAYLKLGQLDSARACLTATATWQDVGQDAVSVSKAKLNLGVIAAKQGHLEEARQWYQGSLEDDPDNPDAWNNVGTTYESLGDTNAAVDAYRKALELRPNAPDPRHNLAGVYFHRGIAALRRGDDSTSIEQLESCIALEPSAVACYDLAIAYGRNHFSDRALALLERALTLDPMYAPAIQLREQLLSGNATFPKASSAP
jgi:tetratricopeptide (TPR) repeat protein